MRLFPRTCITVVATIALLGCGGSNDNGSTTDSNGDASAPKAAAAIVHVDGTITLEGETLTITPKDGSEPHSFALGPEVQQAEVLAIAASKAPARVTYREGEDVAAAVTPAPTKGAGIEAYEGLIVSVDSSSIVIDGSDGERTFDTSAADPGAFDTHHLEAHKTEAEPVRVYFRVSAPDAGISYEDA